MINNQTLHKISNWMKCIVEEQAWERLDDLHVDQISKAFKSRDKWVIAGYNALQEAILIKKEMVERFRIALAIPLAASNKPTQFDFHSLEEISAVLHTYTPPSLYLFSEHSQVWENAVSKGAIQKHLSLNIPMKYCFCTQWYDSSDREYCFTLWLSPSVY